MELVPSVFADANTLYAAALRDILIELALAGAVRLHWSSEVLDELDRAILKVRPGTDPARLASRRSAMNAALPRALIAATEDGRSRFKLPDPDDEPIAAAAWEAHCSVLLTFNLKHFPEPLLAAVIPPLAPMHPDAFLVKMMTENAAVSLPAIEAVRRQLRNPPMSLPDYTASLTRSGLPQTAELLRHLLSGVVATNEAT